MTDSNPTRNRYADNRRAFMDVFGDPFATPEPIDGKYQKMHQRSSVRAVQNNFDEGRATPNPARPSPIDFFCDVENVMKKCIESTILLHKFTETYIVGDITSKDVLSQDERNGLEQRMGKLFGAYRISPVSEYFKTIRRPVGSGRTQRG